MNPKSSSDFIVDELYFVFFWLLEVLSKKERPLQIKIPSLE